MKLIITRKDDKSVAFEMECKEYATFFSACAAIAERFEMPLEAAREWINDEAYCGLRLTSDKFIFKFIPTMPVLIVGHEYTLNDRPFCVYCGVTELKGGYRYNFHQQATCSGIFSLSEREMSEATLTPENKKYHTFQIAYIKAGHCKHTIERIEAINHQTASNIAQLLGEDFRIEFIPTNGDLLYIH